MNIWWVFAYDQYYPGGGLGDLHGTFPTEEAADTSADSLRGRYDFVEVENVMKIAGEKYQR